MQLSYKARFENGTSPKPFTANISFTESGILINYTNEEGHFKQEQWPKASLIEKEFSSSIITLRNGTGVSYKQLEITDRQALSEYRLLFKPNKRKHPTSGRSGRLIVLVIGGFLLALVLSYFYLLPFAADKIAQGFPKKLEIAMGDQLYASILEQSIIDSAKTEAINLFFGQLHIESDYPVRITVVKDTIVNAFAVPGGGIIVYDAILKEMKHPEALAALLAHEYSHVELKHATRNVFRNLAGYVFISIVFSDANSIATIVLNKAENLRTLKYSRDLEQEADANGLEILKRNHLSASGMTRLFEQLKKHETTPLHEALNTHPELNARMDYANAFAKENPYAAEQNDSLNFYFLQLKTETTW
ncbi:MAG: M48 family metallopeptidase [Bacteroidota bacterium]